MDAKEIRRALIQAQRAIDMALDALAKPKTVTLEDALVELIARKNSEAVEAAIKAKEAAEPKTVSATSDEFNKRERESFREHAERLGVSGMLKPEAFQTTASEAVDHVAKMAVWREKARLHGFDDFMTDEQILKEAHTHTVTSCPYCAEIEREYPYPAS